MAHDNVVENFDFQKLTRSDEIAGDLDIRLGWSWITARMIVLWQMMIADALAMTANLKISLG